MKPYQGILALIVYLVLQILVARFISVEYYEPIAGIIALIVFGWLLHKKRMLHLSSRDLKGSQLLFCVGIGLWPGSNFQNSDSFWRFEPSPSLGTAASQSFFLDRICGNQSSSDPCRGRALVPGHPVRVLCQILLL